MEGAACRRSPGCARSAKESGFHPLLPAAFHSRRVSTAKVISKTLERQKEILAL